jgi:transcriptional regulator with XRE-family HTH domain
MRTTEETAVLVELGNKIRTLRTAKGMNQTEFANSIGKDQPSVNRLENGKINPGYLYLRQIAKGLGVELRELLD